MFQNLMVMLLAIAAVSAAQAQQQVEVMHWWTSGGEGAALKVLKSNLEKQGVAWKDSPTAGGGGEQAMTTLRARTNAGIPPTAVQMLGFDIQDWAKEGKLTNLNALADKEGWDKVVPKDLQRFSKYNGAWVSVPVNVHSTNWVWANKEVLAKAGVNADPKSWDDFIAAAEKVQRAGFLAVAHGGQPWQDAIVFDGVALATGGADFYRKALVDLDPAALSSDTMLKIFQRMTQLRQLIGKDAAGRDWNAASALVISGKAGFQIMGDWAKGEFLAANKMPGKDFSCFRMPGSQGSVSFNADQFAMFRVKGSDKLLGQEKLASAIMDKAFQSSFNVVKGSAPARMDVSDKEFDECGKKAIKDLSEAVRKNALVGSFALGHTVSASIKGSMQDVVTRHFNGQISDSKAVAEMASAANR
jgi:glucose/mannose transport system substrate-binding protein